MDKLYNHYLKHYQQLKSQSDFYFGYAQKFVRNLLSLPPSKRYNLLPLFRLIEEEAFEYGVIIPNLDCKELEIQKTAWEVSLRSPTRKEDKKIDFQDSFEQVLFQFTDNHESLFNRLKGYYLFLFENREDTQTNILVLVDDEFKKHPQMDSFENHHSNYQIEKYSIEDFLISIINDPILDEKKYLAILLITPKLQCNELVSNKLEQIFNRFKSHKYIIIRKVPVRSNSDFEFRNSTEGIERIKCNSSKLFNNRSLSFDEDSIIKKCFSGEGIFDYKILKSGYSGSKVIEIQPLRANIPQPARFVVKFAPIGNEKKLEKERDNLRECLMEMAVKSYQFEYVNNETYEAIKYHYASSDSRTDSLPFSELISKYIIGENESKFDLKKVIDDLFSCDPFIAWDPSISKVTASVGDLYKEYLKSEDRIFDTLKLILENDDFSLENNELYRNYCAIKAYTLKTNKKICHGDLHSENFFIDKKGVYLIDFGWTGVKHSIIDFATLECSIKFKHIPYYIDTEELLELDKRLLSIESFSCEMKIPPIKRSILNDITTLILQIREKAKEYMLDTKSPLEYLISLFFISIRQIQYRELNQKYAMKYSLLLSKKILELI